MKKQRLVIYSGYAVLTSIVLMLSAMAFLRGGHPPGYGIINLVIILFVYPGSVYGSIVGLSTEAGAVAGSAKLYFVSVGICVAFTLFATLLMVFKFVLGRAI